MQKQSSTPLVTYFNTVRQRLLGALESFHVLLRIGFQPLPEVEPGSEDTTGIPDASSIPFGFGPEDWYPDEDESDQSDSIWAPGFYMRRIDAEEAEEIRARMLQSGGAVFMPEKTGFFGRRRLKRIR